LKIFNFKDIHFPPCVFKKLTASYNRNDGTNKHDENVGVVPTLSLFDLKYIMPGLAASLENLLEYEGNVKEDFMMNFEVSYTEFDVVKSVPLKENGKNIDLTNENRKEYVNLYIDFLLNKSIYKQFKAFYEGFHTVCASNAMIVRFETKILGLILIKDYFLLL
jgi:E3 ubiquitin-protein ligase HECTD2